MKLSVIMSVHNNADSIEAAMVSVLGQGFKDFEFIVVNDGSTDRSAEVIESFRQKDNRVVVITQDNKGLTKSLNIAIKQAKGEYIARQDADDVSLPDRFLSQVDFLDKNKERGFVGCSCEVVDAGGDFLERIYIDDDPQKNIAALGKGNIFCHGSMMFRKDILERSGGYREFFKYAQDYDLYLRLIEFTLPGAVKKVLYQRKVSWGNISAQKAGLQLAYAGLARQCHEKRLSANDDSSLLNETLLLNNNNRAAQDNYSSDFLHALHCLKNNEISDARIILQAYLGLPGLRNFKVRLLWALSYFPLCVRTAAFWLRDILRRILSFRIRIIL